MSASDHSDLLRLARCIEVCLSPLDYPSVDAWRAAVVHTTKALVDAPKGAFVIAPVSGESPIFAPDYPAEQMTEYFGHWFALDPGLGVIRRAGIDVFTGERLMALEPEQSQQFVRGPVWNDYYLKWGIPGGIGFFVETDYFAYLELTHPQLRPELFGERGHALMQLLLPAFKAGCQIVRTLAGARERLASLIDGLPCGAAVHDERGQRLHVNVKLAAMFATPHGDQLCSVVDGLSGQLAVMMRGKAKLLIVKPTAAAAVSTTCGSYRIAGSIVDDPGFAGRRVGLITVESSAPEMVTPADLEQRFGLTAREAEVVLLVALGKTAAELARALGVSVHTARRHTENAMKKLGVHHRAEVSARLQRTKG